MISRVCGTVAQWNDGGVLVEVNGISYDVLIPSAILRVLQQRIAPGEAVTLVTFHFHQGDMTRSVPVLIGFTNEIEREFFERFITVSGVGPKAALKALALPISAIATAIDGGDVAVLKSLPGIGEQRAREIVAKLQGKVGKFGLIQDYDMGMPEPQAVPALEAFADEAMAVLTQLQYSKPEAKAMVRKALERAPQVKTTEELLNEIYRLRAHTPDLSPAGI